MGFWDKIFKGERLQLLFIRLGQVLHCISKIHPWGTAEQYSPFKSLLWAVSAPLGHLRIQLWPYLSWPAIGKFRRKEGKTIPGSGAGEQPSLEFHIHWYFVQTAIPVTRVFSMSFNEDILFNMAQYIQSRRAATLLGTNIYRTLTTQTPYYSNHY